MVGQANAAFIIRTEVVTTSPGAGPVNVGVFATSSTNLLLGGYDIPVNFGAAGVTPLPAGISYLVPTVSLITSGSTLALIADTTGLGDVVVSDAVTGMPPVYPPLVAGVEVKLFDLRFDVGAAAPGAQFAIAPITSGHLFFNINDQLGQQFTVTNVLPGSLTIAIPEPNGFAIVGLFSSFYFSSFYFSRRRRLRT